MSDDHSTYKIDEEQFVKCILESNTSIKEEEAREMFRDIDSDQNGTIEYQELINALNIRIESEQRELEEMFEQKRRKELEAVSDIIEDAGLAPEEVTEVLQQYIESRRANAS